MNINTEPKRSREYIMYRDNILKCNTFIELVNTVRSMIERDNLQPGELEKLKKTATRREFLIQNLNQTS